MSFLRLGPCARLHRRGGATPIAPAPAGYLNSVELGGRTLMVDDGAGGPVAYQLDACGTYMLVGPCRILSDSLAGTPGRHGATLNPVARGQHGWDDRLFTIGGGPGVSLYSAAARVAFPATINPGDTIVFFESNGPHFLPAGQDGRNPAGRWHPIHCIAAPVSSPGSRFAPEALRGASPYRARGVSEVIDFDGLLASLPSLPIPAGKIPLATILAKMARHTSAAAMTRVDNFPGGYEAGAPTGLVLNGAAQGGYSQFLGHTWMVASQHILDASNPLESRRTLLKWMIAHGRDYFLPQLNDIDQVGHNGGGHFTGQIIPAMWALWAMGETTLLTNYGTPAKRLRDNTYQIAAMTSGLLAKMVEHTNPLWPHSFRRREVTAVGAGTITVRWDRSGGADPYWCNLHGLRLKKAGDGATVYGTVNNPNSKASSGSPEVVTLTISGLGAIAPGDSVWFDTPWPLAVGSPAWCISGWEETYPAAGGFPSLIGLSAYTASPRATYMDQQTGAFEMIAILAALFGLADTPRWAPIVDFVIYKNRSNFPGSAAASCDFADWKFAGDNPDGAGFVSMAGFYDAHMQNLVGATRFNQTIGYS